MSAIGKLISGERYVILPETPVEDKVISGS